MTKASQSGKKRAALKKKAVKKTAPRTNKHSFTPATIAVWLLAVLFVLPMIFKSNSIIQDTVAKNKYDVEQIGNYVTLIGDSISHQSQQELREALPGVDIEAVGGIYFYDYSKFGDGGFVRLKKHAMRDVVAFLLGSNEGVTREWLDELYEYVGTNRKLILMTIYRGDRFNDAQGWNALIADFAQNHENVYLMDWFSENVNNVDKYLIFDHLHPNQAGREHFAHMVRRTVLKALDLTK